MWEVIGARIALMILLGIALFWYLLYIIGIFESRYLKKRGKESEAKQEKKKREIVSAYLFLLCCGVILYFLILELWIRDVV